MTQYYEFNPTIRDEDTWDAANRDEHQWWPRTLWMDPGGVSGAAVVWFNPVKLLDKHIPMSRCILAWQSFFLHGAENSHTDAFVNMVKELGGPSGLSVGTESFQLRKMNTDEEAFSPLRIRAAVDFQLWRGTKDRDDIVRRRPLFKQSPSDAKRTFTTDRLRKMVLYTPGPDHARDATSHCLLHLRKMRGAGRENFTKVFGWEEEWEQ